GHYVDVDNLEGRRVLWAEHAINRIVELIRFDAKTQTIKDERQRKLGDIVTQYDALRRPALLKARLESLTDGSGTTVADNFLTHRNWFSAKFSSDEPKTAAFVKELLRAYPAV